MAIENSQNTNWDDFFTSTERVPKDFMVDRDDSTPQERDFFKDTPATPPDSCR